MRIKFDQTKTVLVFLPEGNPEVEALTAFPGFSRRSLFFICPAIVPIAFNLVSRVKAKFKNCVVDPEVQKFIDQDFRLAQLPESFKYHTSPKKFQDIALRFLYTLGSAGLLLEPGMGKSKVTLDYIFLKGFKKSVIVCPKPLLFVWEDEIFTHRPELSYYVVGSTSWEKEEEGIKNAQVVIINYSKAVKLASHLKMAGFDFIHLDEFLIKSPTTARTIRMTELAAVIPHRCGGSGTLINNTPLDLYAPVKFLQPSLVGGNYKNFESRYAVKTKKHRFDAAKGKKIPYSVITGYRDLGGMRAILDSCCVVMSKEEWLPLPEKVFHDVEVPMGETQRYVYNTLRGNFISDIPGSDEVVEVDNPLAMMSKLYQVANGFIYISPPGEEEPGLIEESGESLQKTPRKTIFFEDNPKIDALKGLLSGNLSERKGILWYNFSAELEGVEQTLKDLGLPYLVIKGGEKDVGGKVREFNRSKDLRWLVCQAKSVNYGITVLGVQQKAASDEDEVDAINPKEVVPDLDEAVYTEVFVSMSFSLEVYLQQQDRIHRIGQTHTCEYYRIFSKSPVERRIRDAIDTKMELRGAMLVDIANALKLESLLV